MSAKMHWNLLILFGVLCQGLIATLSEKDIEESSEHLIRQKRVINLAPGGDIKENIRNVPYVVHIKEFRTIRIDEYCVGAILTHHVVLTVAKCLESQLTPELMRVYSGTAQIRGGGHPIVHNVTAVRTRLSDHDFRHADGIALLTVNPPFTYSVNTRNIVLYQGHIHPGLYGTVSGWGCNYGQDLGTAHPNHLRSINVPIISNHDCAMLYLNTLPITNSDICTLDASGHQQCGLGDAGAPLVIEVNYHHYLAGVHLWNGAVVGRSNPDVFVDLQHPRYKAWIAETIRNL